MSSFKMRTNAFGMIDVDESSFKTTTAKDIKGNSCTSVVAKTPNGFQFTLAGDWRERIIDESTLKVDEKKTAELKADLATILARIKVAQQTTVEG